MSQLIEVMMLHGTANAESLKEEEEDQVLLTFLPKPYSRRRERAFFCSYLEVEPTTLVGKRKSITI